jgi:DNA-binding SARP family transcriptional activator/TolB-like protein/Tfp pilus assembly protein PilF
MFTLYLFGAPRIEGPEGTLSGRVAQRHPLALLALLATAPAAVVGREKLIGLLWPESDAEHGRGALNVAVHAVRKALGEEAIRSGGTALQLEPRAVATDVAAFEAALAAGDAVAAVALYRGPFLDGFFMESGDFDRWAEGERRRLADLYAGALERMAEDAAARGDVLAAVAGWKRRAAHDPYDSRVTLALMRTMAEVGDRSGALQQASVHAALMRDDVGAAPDPAVAAFAARLRAAPDSQPHPSAGFRERDADLVAAVPAGTRPLSMPPEAPPPDGAGQGAPVAPPIARGPAPLRAWGAPAAAAALLLGVAAAFLAFWWMRELPAAAATTVEPVVLVLPFDALRGDGGRGADDQRDEYFRDGLTDELINALARIPGIHVIPRTTAFAMRGERLDLHEIGQRLGVTSVLEGSVRRDADRLRVNVNLVDVADRRVRWSEQYDARGEAVLDLQNRIARSAAEALHGALGGTEPNPEPLTRDVEAFTLYLQGRWSWYRRTPRGLHEALGRFEEASRLDPEFAHAYVGIADVYNVMGGLEYALMPAVQARDRAFPAAERALELAPGLGEAHAAMGNALLNDGGRCAEAVRYFRRAIELNPGHADAHHWHSLCLLALERPDQASAAIHRARLLDPQSPIVAAALGRHLYYQRSYPRAAAEYRRAIGMDPTLASGWLGLAIAMAQMDSTEAAHDALAAAAAALPGGHPAEHALNAYLHGRTGRHDLARAGLERLVAMARSGRYVPDEYFVTAYLGMGDHERALTSLERAVEARSPGTALLHLEPMLDPLRTDPRFERLLARTAEARTAPSPPPAPVARGR